MEAVVTQHVPRAAPTGGQEDGGDTGDPSSFHSLLHSL